TRRVEMTTSMRTIGIASAVVLAVLAGCAEKKGPAPMPPSTTTTSSREKGEMRQTETTTAQAKVVEVDQKEGSSPCAGPTGTSSRSASATRSGTSRRSTRATW